MPSSAYPPDPTSKGVAVSNELNAPTEITLSQHEPENESELEMPGTPPMEIKNRRIWGEATSKQTEARRLMEQEMLQPEDRHVARHAAARVTQRLVRCFLARRRLSTRLSAVGRPVELQIRMVENLQMLCDFRNVVAVLCNVRVLKKPFGPFMFHFSTSKCTDVNQPNWEDTFFVPLLSSKCDIVITLIGVTNGGKMRFLGQAIAPMEPGWEYKTNVSAPLAKWKFPVDESIIGLHRFVKGIVHLEIKPVSSRMPLKSGQFMLARPNAALMRRSFSFWSKQVSSNKLLASPAPLTPKKAPASLSPSRKTMVTRWGVLTDTAFHLFDNSTAKLLISLDLAKLQLIKSSEQPSSDVSRLFPLKLYAKGTMYVLYVSSYAQLQSWEYKIDLHRRELLIP